MVKTDVVIVGAGPCGLFQVFELGLLGLKAHVVDSIRQPGGQCSELYPDKPIYDIPAIPECTGDELTNNLLKQIAPFGPVMHMGEEVAIVREDGDGFFLETDKGTQFNAKAVVIAAGVGSFQPRPLRAKGIEELNDNAIQYRVRNPQQYAGKRLAILGGGDSALDWVVALAPIAEHVTLVHRRDEYRAVDSTVAAMRELEQQGKVTTIENAKASELQHKDGALKKLIVANKEKQSFEIDADHRAGVLRPSTEAWTHRRVGLGHQSQGPLTLILKSLKPRPRGSTPSAISTTTPGKKKLILCGFHEAALAAFAIKQRIEPDKKVHVQYTTTSPIMHERLGVDPADS